MKKILFVINTLGHAGAEAALIELLEKLSGLKSPANGGRMYDIDLFVLTGQGEMVHELPEGVRLVNRTYNDSPVLGARGRSYLKRTVIKALFRRGNVVRLIPYLAGNVLSMLKAGRILPDKLLWRVISDGADRLEDSYELAVAYLEGGSAYYVAEHVSAARKAAFIHVDYNSAGYTRRLDRDCYLKYDRIFTVSGETGSIFKNIYPECAGRTEVFSNIISRDKIIAKSRLAGGFSDDFDGCRLLSVGRLERQKAFEVSIDAMRLLKDRGINVRWYVLGEGSERRRLEAGIREAALDEDFLLLGAVDNPYPYMAQADIYVHASRFEGKSIAIQEAQILGRPIIVSDCSGNREQVKNGIDGIMCSLDASAIANSIQKILNDGELARRLGEAASDLSLSWKAETDKILSLLE